MIIDIIGLQQRGGMEGRRGPRGGGRGGYGGPPGRDGFGGGGDETTMRVSAERCGIVAFSTCKYKYMRVYYASTD